MKRERDPNILGLPVRPGRPRADPLASPKLSPAQERELADAEAGKLEWVSPAVAAYKLGITVDALAKRRQLDHPDTPRWKQTTPGGKVFYRWDYFHRLRPVQHIEVEALRRELELVKKESASAKEEAASAKEEAASVKDLLLVMLQQTGISLDALRTMANWALDERGRLAGHALLLEGREILGFTCVGYTWQEALEQPWVSEAARAPYAAAVLEFLAHARLRVASPRG